MANPGTGHLLGRDIVYQNLKPGSLLVGETQEVEELEIGLNNQVLTVVAGELTWYPLPPATDATGQNLGLGEKILVDVVDSHFIFRSLLAGDAVVLTESTNEITIDVDINELLGLMGSGVLGDPTTGTLQDPAYPGANGPAIQTWTASTPVTDAIVDLNKVLGLILPEQPPLLTAIVFEMAGGSNTRDGELILLATGVANNTGLAPIPAGDQVYRISSATGTSATSPQFGPGLAGDVSAVVNGSIDGTITLERGDDSGTDGSLTVVTDEDYPPSDPGVFEAITARVSSAVAVGLSRFQLTHTASGDSNNATFVYDDISNTPNASGIFAVEAGGNPPYGFSSGVQHLAGGSTINVDATVDNLSSNAYLSAGVIQIGASGGIGSTIDVDPGSFGIPSILTVSEPPKTVTTVPFVISNTTFSSGSIRARGRNANATGSWALDTFDVNAMASIPNNKIDELNVDVSAGTVPGGAKSTAERVLLGAGDTPDTSSLSGTTVAGWDSTALVPAHESTVVGGVLRNDVTDYSTGHMPAGPNYSTHDAVQYVTWYFRRATVSNFTIDVTGSYAGMWVTLQDVDFGTAPNEWIDMFQLYAGAGIPGANGSNGCAVGSPATGGSGTFGCTFGLETSSNASNNIILVRLRLNSGQAVTDLSF